MQKLDFIVIQVQIPASRTNISLHCHLRVLTRHALLSCSTTVTTTSACIPALFMASPGACQAPSLLMSPVISVDTNAKPLPQPSHAISPAPHHHYVNSCTSPLLHGKDSQLPACLPHARRLQRAAGTHSSDDKPWKIEVFKY